MHAPIGRAGKACRQRTGCEVARLIPRAWMGGKERRGLRSSWLAVRSWNAGRKESLHLIERPGKMNRSALRENLRALVVVAEPETKAAMVRGRDFRIASVQSEARQYARRPGEAA